MGPPEANQTPHSARRRPGKQRHLTDTCRPYLRLLREAVYLLTLGISTVASKVCVARAVYVCFALRGGER